MKTYKIRSLVYLGCFIATAIIYYNFEQQGTLDTSDVSASVAENQFEDSLEEEKALAAEDLHNLQ